jgi:hypothetical protein
MRHLTFCGRKLLILPAIALALLAASVDAHAATPAVVVARTAAWTGNTGSTVCTGPPIFSDYNQPGNCKFTGTGTGLFIGQFKTPATLIDPTLCPQQAVDPTDIICGHFGMDFSSVEGSVTVGITFNGDNDLDLCAIDSNRAIVNECSTGSGATESVTFNVKCADTRYEAQILVPVPRPHSDQPRDLHRDCHGEPGDVLSRRQRRPGQRQAPGLRPSRQGPRRRQEQQQQRPGARL